MRFLLILALLFLSACGVEDILLPPVSEEKHEEHIEIITIGPYTELCHDAFFDRDCLVEYNEDAGRWGSSTRIFRALILNRDLSTHLR